MADYIYLSLIVATLVSANGQNMDTLKVEESVLPNLAKEVEDNSRYKTLEANATVLKLLVDDKDGVSRTEVFDMLHSRDDNEKHIDLPTFPEDEEDFKAEVPAMPDFQAEFLQSSSDSEQKNKHRYRAPSYTSPRGEPTAEAAGIMVIITCSIVCIAYTALIVWRRIYLKRHGLKHELLINEEVVAETRLEV